MPSFIEAPPFPDNMSYRSIGGPRFLTGVVEMKGRQEQRTPQWQGGRHEYDASERVKTRTDIALIRTYFNAVLGKTYSFRLNDWDDNTSDSVEHIAPPTDTDQQIGVGDGVEIAFQLVKNYTWGPRTYVRPIQKPIVGTTVISFDDVSQPAGWTVDTTTGIVTFGDPPGVGVVIKAGFSFDVPCRFDIDYLPISADDFGIRSSSIPIIEIDPTYEESFP